MIESGMMTNQEKQRMRNAVNELVDNQKEIIRLRYWEYQTIEEIASKLKMTWAQVNKQLDESIEELRIILFLDLAKEVEGE